MKKTFLYLILGLVVCFKGRAQLTIYNYGTTPENMNVNNTYIKDIDNYNNQVVGVWKWEKAIVYLK